ncbi:MAG: DUF4827 family protein [Paludibacteraceae bacterium]
MRKIVFFSAFIVLVSLLASCRNDDSYSALQKKEENTIKAYIKREGIDVVTTLPTTWNENTYYLSPSGLYFHLEDKGNEDKTLNTTSKTKIGFYTIEYELDENKTILSKKWESGDVPGGSPITLIYGDSYYYTVYGTGIYEAIGLMKNKESVAKIIVPSFLNTSSYSNVLKAVSYDIRIAVVN